MRKRYLNTVGRQEALGLVRNAVCFLDRTEEIPVTQCKGRITAGSIRALVSNPPYTCAAMDGYAVSFESTLEADLSNPITLTRGTEAIALNTGDPLPPSMNAVIMVEDAEEREQEIVIRKAAHLWQHVRLTGEDIIEGDILFPANYTLSILDLGLMLAAGITVVNVKQRPRLFIVPTGHELIDIYQQSVEELKQHRLIDFNSYLLKALGEEMGFEVTRGEIARNKGELRQIMTHQFPDHDVFVINAGSSAGTEDITEGIIQEFGEVIFHGVSMMPGKPSMFGLVKGKPVFGIPGYPVSAVIAFRTFLQAAYDRLSGTHKSESTVDCVTPFKIASSIGVEEVLRVRLVNKDQKYYAYPLPRGASVFSSLSQADGLVRVPENLEGYLEGETVRADLLRAEDDLQNRINIIGSHDLSLDVLRDMIKSREPAMDLVSAHVGSLSGIMAMQKGIIDLATTHILDEGEKIYNIPILKKYLPDKQFLVVHIAKRIQGLLTAKGNPKGIKGIEDLPRPGIRFVNRQYGSGTRILIDMMLKERGIDRESIQGYDREESTHAATAIIVKEDIADVGLAIQPVSRIFSLDFIPLMEEEYDLVVTKEFSDDPKFTLLMELLTSPQFTSRLEDLGGYNTKDTGKIKYVSP